MFHINLLSNVCVKRPKINYKEAQDGPFKNFFVLYYWNTGSKRDVSIKLSAVLLASMEAN